MRTYNMTMPTLTSVRGQTLLTDTKPYLYRQSPVAAQMLDLSLTGGTVAWNQLVENGNFVDSTGWTTGTTNTLTVSGGVARLAIASGTSANNRDIRATTQKIVDNGHVYLVTYDALGYGGFIGGNMSLRETTSGIVIVDSFGTLTATKKRFSAICKPTGLTDPSGSSYLRRITAAPSPVTIGDYFEVSNLMSHDLTAMFNPTIADYVYSLETQTAGSGIAFLQSYGFFTEDYYPYDAGSLLSVKTSGHKTVGKNLWAGGALTTNHDANITVVTTATTLYGKEATKINVTGTTTSWGHRIRWNNIRNILQPSTTYRFTFLADADYPYGLRVASSSSQHTLIDQKQFTRTQLMAGLWEYSVEVTTVASDNTAWDYTDQYAQLVPIPQTLSPVDITVVNELCVTLASAPAGYAPYTEHVYLLSNIELRGIPKLVNNELQYDGDEYASDGTVTRRFGIVDLGTLDWAEYGGQDGLFYSDALNTQIGATTGAQTHGICDKYLIVTNNDHNGSSGAANELPNMCGRFRNSDGRLYFRNSAYNGQGGDAFKTAMSGIYLVYALATPTTETTDPFTNPQQAGSTEEYVDERTVPMPVGHVSEYFNMEQIKRIQMFMPTT